MPLRSTERMFCSARRIAHWCGEELVFLNANARGQSRRDKLRHAPIFSSRAAFSGFQTRHGRVIARRHYNGDGG